MHLKAQNPLSLYIRKYTERICKNVYTDAIYGYKLLDVCTYVCVYVYLMNRFMYKYK